MFSDGKCKDVTFVITYKRATEIKSLSLDIDASNDDIIFHVHRIYSHHIVRCLKDAQTEKHARSSGLNDDLLILIRIEHQLQINVRYINIYKSKF